MPTSNDYDGFAEAYAQDNEINAWNAYYERPAILSMAGDVAGRHVLDAGCGSGAHAAELIDQGAFLTGIDNSASMLEIARSRSGSRARFILADLERALPFNHLAFDLVIAPLVLHYLPSWDVPLSEFHRVLRPGGRLVFSVHHPFMDHNPSTGKSYFDTYEFQDEWILGGRSVRMRFWHRPLDAMFCALKDAGFTVDELREPMPDVRALELYPEAYRVLSTAPRFLFISADKSRIRA
ncbi:class I SAM-dependent methyltransferase [Xanthomonas graminis]|uniref:class I SAM-dependent methyltransferase n=1 Tax=Xanthomonas graminis TaxID=3390026 RepID=UPI001F00D142|nr:class I SAM-dependent methyltransferase [Xanthomonas translucens]UKE73363.1 methyltransferase domain-containing protein [Xanthomonas translucens pv. phleipratensis]